eukprot:TRINITY_DN31503_c0_g1_i1.p1 TRINITY_DN31503_c0_g1~~TRINITY_DN31503_c0_g1_i1.p1  ORF type:complete len:115 (+),score=6.82 TRINITY_DN31503_c0_g1_i1:467-811(+)
MRAANGKLPPRACSARMTVLFSAWKRVLFLAATTPAGRSNLWARRSVVSCVCLLPTPPDHELHLQTAPLAFSATALPRAQLTSFVFYLAFVLGAVYDVGDQWSKIQVRRPRAVP